MDSVQVRLPDHNGPFQPNKSKLHIYEDKSEYEAQNQGKV